MHRKNCQQKCIQGLCNTNPRCVWVYLLRTEWVSAYGVLLFSMPNSIFHWLLSVAPIPTKIGTILALFSPFSKLNWCSHNKYEHLIENTTQKNAHNNIEIFYFWNVNTKRKKNNAQNKKRKIVTKICNVVCVCWIILHRYRYLWCYKRK